MFKDRMGKQLTFAEVVKKAEVRFANYLLDFTLMILRWVGHIPVHFIRRFLYRLFGVKIGAGSVIHMWCNFFNPKGVEIGEDSIIGNHAFLDGRAPLKIGNHISIASQVLIYNSEHDINSEDFRVTEEPVIIEDFVYIGARVIILPGVTIGKGAVVASGAVVTKDISPMSIVGGIPAREIGKRNIKNLSYRLGRARLFQ